MASSQNKRLGWLAGGLVFAVLVAGAAYWVAQPRWPVPMTIGDQQFAVRIAETPLQQQNGLRGVTTLTPQQGMLFIFPSAEIQTFTMQGMSIALDLVWIADGKVVGITPNVPPDPWESTRRYRSPQPVEWVLELAAGAAAAAGLAPGQTVSIDRP